MKTSIASSSSDWINFNAKAWSLANSKNIYCMGFWWVETNFDWEEKIHTPKNRKRDIARWIRNSSLKTKSKLSLRVSFAFKWCSHSNFKDVAVSWSMQIFPFSIPFSLKLLTCLQSFQKLINFFLFVFTCSEMFVCFSIQRSSNHSTAVL